jgi:hypothetical protein
MALYRKSAMVAGVAGRGGPNGVRLTLAIAAAAGSLSSATLAQTARVPVESGVQASSGCRNVSLPVVVGRPSVQYAVRHGTGAGGSGGNPWTDDCNRVSNLSSYDFSGSGGTFLVEAGMGQQEMAAVSYQLTAADFPLKINTCDVLWATSGATVQTTTQWSVFIWAGPPNTGTQVDMESSDGVILQPVVVGPGTAATILSFSVDPTDPDQIIVNDNGTHILSIGFRIDHHNNQTQDPCTTAPPSNSNAFMCVDHDQSNPTNPNNNWLDGLNCGLGQFNCPPGNSGALIWGTFTQMGTNPFPCEPHGDWVMRATWQSVNCQAGVGACCHADGSCVQDLATNCTGAGMTYEGDNVQCANVTCPVPTGACCFSNGNCLARTSASCTSLGGTWLGAGTTCNGSLCPTGACCFADGSCNAGLTSQACTTQGGTFHGVGVTCAAANCPQPTGACCTGNGGCDILSQGDCAVVGGTWHGTGTTCAVSCPPPTGACCTGSGGCDLLTQSDCGIVGGVWHGSGSTCADACGPACYANCDNSTTTPLLNVSDFTCFLQKFAQGNSYANCDQSTSVPVLNVADFTCFLQKFAQGCP